MKGIRSERKEKKKKTCLRYFVEEHCKRIWVKLKSLRGIPWTSCWERSWRDAWRGRNSFWLEEELRRQEASKDSFKARIWQARNKLQRSNDNQTFEGLKSVSQERWERWVELEVNWLEVKGTNNTKLNKTKSRKTWEFPTRLFDLRGRSSEGLIRLVGSFSSKWACLDQQLFGRSCDFVCWLSHRLQLLVHGFRLRLIDCLLKY